jgi:uncharacterized protein
MYRFEGHADFRDRAAELDRLERWWNDETDRLPVVVAGRRRTGKSWLCRELAHDRPADVLVCDRRAERDQLATFAARLGEGPAAPPEAPDLRGFFRQLFWRARDRRRLTVIDAFPELLRLGHNAGVALAEVMREEAGASRLKLVLCGSQVATMEALLEDALSGRGHWLDVPPLGFAQARAFLGRRPPAELVARYAVAGGMPGYLRRLALDASLRAAICRQVLDPWAPLFDEPRRVLEGEQVGGAVHFSLLRALAEHRELAWDGLLAHSGVDDGNASRAMRTLQDMEIVEATSPLFADPLGRRRRYRLRDRLTRFWLRFVFPWQEELRAGLPAERHFDEVVAPSLPEHAAEAFEEICRTWVAGAFADRADVVGRWWGPVRRARRSQEIAIVGGRDRRATVIGACAWGRRRMPAWILDELMGSGVPALARAGVDADGAAIVLFSRSGFSRELEAAAGSRVRLMSLDEVLGDLQGSTLVR